MHLTAAGTDPLDDPVLASAVGTFRALQGRPLAATLPILGRVLYPVVHRALAADGILTRTAPSPGVSMRPATTWRTTDPEPERRVRSTLRRVLDGEQIGPEQRRHARVVVVLLAATGTLQAALADLPDDVRASATRTGLPADVGPVCAAVVRALRAD